MIFLSHPTGNEFVRHAALALTEAGLLAEFDTCIAWDRGSLVNKFIPAPLRSKLFRRSLPPQVLGRTKTFPLRETMRLLALQLGLRRFFPPGMEFLWIDAVYRDLDRQASLRLRRLKDIKAVYAYEDGALEIFKEAHRRGIPCIYDLPIGYWRAAHELFREEADREPQWAATLTGLKDNEEKLARKDQELSLADMILVMSSFTRNTLKRANGVRASIQEIPLGAPPVSPKIFKTGSLQNKVKVIFVGSLNQRKGLSYLLKAVSDLGKDQVELTLVGRRPNVPCLPLTQALSSYRWVPSLPHHEILKLIQENDVLVLPSLFEGFGLVILEAMSQGVPVITTPHTCGPDIISDGIDGFIVPIRSAEAIAEKIRLFKNRDFLITMSEQAVAKAALYHWERYRRSITETVLRVTGEARS